MFFELTFKSPAPSSCVSYHSAHSRANFNWNVKLIRGVNAIEKKCQISSSWDQTYITMAQQEERFQIIRWIYRQEEGHFTVSLSLSAHIHTERHIHTDAKREKSSLLGAIGLLYLLFAPWLHFIRSYPRRLYSYDAHHKYRGDTLYQADDTRVQPRRRRRARTRGGDNDGISRDVFRIPPA